MASTFAVVFGGALLFVPAAFYKPTGIELTPLLATLAQAHGATLIGLGVINWLSRGATGATARPVLAGNLVVQALSLAVVLRTMSLGAGAAVAPGVIIHVTMGALFALFLVRSRSRAA